MTHTGSGDPFSELKMSHRDYKVFDAHYERIGKVDELFVDEEDHPVYLSVSTGFLDAMSVIVPMEMVRINDKRGLVEVDTSRRRIEEAPRLAAGKEIAPELEDRVRVYYDLRPLPRSHRSAEVDARIHDARGSDQLAPDERIDLVPGEREATQQDLEGDPPYRERSKRPQRTRERETPDRELATTDSSSVIGEPVEAPQAGISHPGQSDGEQPVRVRVRRIRR